MCYAESCNLPSLPYPAPTPATIAIMPSHQLTQPMKPKLPRRLASSARINLNRYWQALEDLMPLCRKPFDESDSNAINENLDNERRLAAMRLSASGVQRAEGAPATPNKLAAMRLSGVQRAEGVPATPMGEASVAGRNISSNSFSKVTSLSSASNSNNTSLLSRTSTSLSTDCSSFSLMSEDEFSSDENTPPPSFGKQ